MIRPAAITTAAGLSLIVVAAQALDVLWQGPTVFTTFPVVLAAPLFLGLPTPLVVALPAIAFWLWSYQLFTGSGAMPRRTLILLAGLALLSTAWYVRGFRDGIRWEGPIYTWTGIGMSALSVAVIGCLAIRASRSPSFLGSLGAHWLLFAWSASYAFAWLGEAP